MKHIKINLEVIKALKPCEDRLDDYMSKFSGFEGSLVDFLSLEGLLAEDKIWVSLRLIPRDELEIFAIDCAFSATAAKAVYSAYFSAYSAAYVDAQAVAAAHCDAEAAKKQERENQVDALIYLCKGM